MTWHTIDYTLDEKGSYVVNINGEDVRAILNSNISTDLRYSFDGKTLVTRPVYSDYEKTNPFYEERVYSAIVSGNSLTISDGSTTTVYTK